MLRRLGPTSEAMDGESEEAVQQERSRDGAATSGFEALRYNKIRAAHQIPNMALTSSDAIVAGSQGGVNVISTLAFFTPSMAST